MCDYSLHHVASTPAKVGDILTTTAFEGSITRGFCAAGATGVAVCVPPGAELAFERDVECDRVFPFLRRRKIAAREARFRQVDTNNPNTHHDALEFSNGKIVLLTELSLGQRAQVLQLPVVGKPAQAPAKAAPAEPGAPRHVA